MIRLLAGATVYFPILIKVPLTLALKFISTLKCGCPRVH